ncbi:hypothetical protein BJ165DRAFT_220499 [Panaeolus papilionaceus]|nr:hypothetical protein BJ165DRAFT_220499 [Panaeolus papilionaceus]
MSSSHSHYSYKTPDHPQPSVSASPHSAPTPCTGSLTGTPTLWRVSSCVCEAMWAGVVIDDGSWK